MPNIYYQATLYPTSIHLSPMHQSYLKLTYAKMDIGKDGRFYVYWPESISEDIDDFYITEAIDEGSITKEQAEFIRKTSFNEVLRHILHHNPEETHIKISGAWTCDKMKPGWFGGSTCIVTRKSHLDISTGDAVFNEKTGKIEVNYEVREFPDCGKEEPGPNCPESPHTKKPLDK